MAQIKKDVRVKRCAVCGKFQKSTTQMVMHNNKTVCPVCAAKLNITAKVIEAGPRGVTKHQMIPAIKENINNIEVLANLYKEYPTVFRGSVRYLHKNEMDIIFKHFNINTEINEEYAILLNKLNPSRKGVTYHQIINAIKEAKNNNDKNIVVLIKKYYGDLLAKCAKYLRKDYRKFAGV